MTNPLDRLPAAMITPGTTIRTRTVVLVTVPVLLAVGLSLLWYESQRVLGLDAYYYVEYTKDLTHSRPAIFGTNWPRGYPLLGAFLTRMGASPFMALFTISALSLLALTTASANLLPRELRASPTAFTVLCGACAVPAVPLLLGMPMSEITFAALLLLSVFFVKHWPEKWAVWLTLFLGFSAFCIRYAGIFTFGLFVVYFVLHFDDLRHRGRLRFAGGWFAFFAGLTAFLLWSNVQATGHISGADRGFGGGPAVVPEQIAHLGWAAVGAVSSTQIDEMLGGVASIPGLLIGWIVMAGIAAICLRAVFNPKEPMARPLALLVLSYLGAFVAMRALRSFPDINEPRYFVPVLFPLVVVFLLETRLQARRFLVVGAAAAILLGGALSLRGISQETYGDVSFAREILDAALQPGDVVMVNAGALSLSAYYDNEFVWTRCGRVDVDATPDYVVVTAVPSRRGATRVALDTCGRELVAGARRRGYVERRRAHGGVILQRDVMTEVR